MLVGGAQLCIIDAAHHLLPKEAVSDRGIVHSSNHSHQTAFPLQHQGVEGETLQALSPNNEGDKLISKTKLTSNIRQGCSRTQLRHLDDTDEEICSEPHDNNFPQLT